MTVPFASPLAAEIEAFLRFKRALGHRYQRAEYTLLNFDRFAERQVTSPGPIDMRRLILEWLASANCRKPVSVTNELGVIRQFCLFQRRTDPDAFVPGREWAPQSTESDFLPHVLSEAEVRLLLAMAEKIRRPALISATARALILVLYCTGLRIGEALRLELCDVDLSEATFYIRDSKGRSRWVPFRGDLADELKLYRRVRDPLASVAPDAPLFVRPNGERLSMGAASGLLRRLLRKAGLKPQRGRRGPRPYDLRHTFAVHRLTSWYRDGVEIASKLPWLSAYMGHQDIVGTEVYLTATPELLEIVGRRFESRLAETDV